eukprot:gnl/MRDRNA2_/MRDRNA2_71273_c0_seq1.p1 gnl/MRDRNA2_/MRDRNA2_71273_c0~~gnl/MRDRNA2_/MRDRNA2_71273_c0_seq1.p1  ORF type:complete len:1104 (+),score=133.99 gnl/MRDRNA2_/MRDRNA2_71273_c0_seq1:64-3312(+)
MASPMLAFGRVGLPSPMREVAAKPEAAPQWATNHVENPLPAPQAAAKPDASTHADLHPSISPDVLLHQQEGVFHRVLRELHGQHESRMESILLEHEVRIMEIMEERMKEQTSALSTLVSQMPTMPTSPVIASGFRHQERENMQTNDIDSAGAPNMFDDTDDMVGSDCIAQHESEITCFSPTESPRAPTSPGSREPLQVGPLLIREMASVPSMVSRGTAELDGCGDAGGAVSEHPKSRMSLASKNSDDEERRPVTTLKSLVKFARGNSAQSLSSSSSFITLLGQHDEGSDSFKSEPSLVTSRTLVAAHGAGAAHRATIAANQSKPARKQSMHSIEEEESSSHSLEHKPLVALDRGSIAAANVGNRQPPKSALKQPSDTTGNTSIESKKRQVSGPLLRFEADRIGKQDNESMELCSTEDSGKTDGLSQTSSTRSRNIMRRARNKLSLFTTKPSANRASEPLSSAANKSMKMQRELNEEIQNMKRSKKRMSWQRYVEEHEMETRRQELMRLKRSNRSRVQVSADDLHFKLQKYCMKISRSKKFDILCAILIVANAVVIGAQTDWAAKNIGTPVPLTYIILGMFFTIAFTSELLVRMIAYGLKRFVTARDWRWNLFDTFIVVSGLCEESLTVYAMVHDLNPNSQADAKKIKAISMISILRLIRITRVLRVMQFSRDLRVMLYGIWNSLRSLAWAILLLLLVMFCVSVCVTQVITDRIVEGSISREYGDENLQDYRTLTKSAYGLFKSISGGVDWGNIADPLLQVSPILIILFGIYIAFAVFCVLNVVTGVFVDNTKRITETDIDHIIMDQLSKRSEFLHEIERLWNEITVRCNSSPSGQAKGPGLKQSSFVRDRDFDKAIGDMRIRAYFRRIGLFIEIYNSSALFKMIDSDHDGVIDFNDFAIGCEQLRGEAQKLDITRLRIESRNMINGLKALENSQNRHFRCMRGNHDISALKQGLNNLAKFCQGHFHRSHGREQELVTMMRTLLVSGKVTVESSVDVLEQINDIYTPNAIEPETEVPDCPWPNDDVSDNPLSDFSTPQIGCVGKVFQSPSDSRGSDDPPSQGSPLKTAKPGTITKIRKSPARS